MVIDAAIDKPGERGCRMPNAVTTSTQEQNPEPDFDFLELACEREAKRK